MNSPDGMYLCASYHKESNVLFMSVESFITVFLCQYCDLDIEIFFLDYKEIIYPYAVQVDLLQRLNYQLWTPKNIHVQEINFLLPAIITDQGKTVIAGLCAVLRWAIKAHLIKYPDHYCQTLLGFRGGCLVACTESSVWTKFCELQLPSSVKDLSSKVKHEDILTQIPENLVILEAHLKRPVRTHNILKRKLDLVKKVKQTTISNDPVDIKELDSNFTLYDKDSIPVDKVDLPEKLQNMSITEKSKEFSLNHCYLEGIDLTLADMIVFPCVHYLLSHLPVEAGKYLENVIRWYRNMCSNALVKRAAEKTGVTFKSFDKTSNSEVNESDIIVPDISQLSLYTRDPSHTKLRCKHQSPEKIISLLLAAGICPNYDASYSSKLQWDSLPSLLHPAQGDLPQKRLERKCQQLESIVTAVLKIAKNNQIIVEFCAGGGHVGLLLAYYLPNCKILLIENKESSMMRAKSRAAELNLTNVFFYQCNLDYFIGSFDIGISLHACGVATDLVIQQCIQKQASFVCCPCCYGNIQDTHLLHYPLSKKFQSTALLKKGYTLLAHFADRNEVNTPTAEQGELCMGFIDTDRCFYAEERGYKTYLTTLQPVTCSPKHNLLIGVSPIHTGF